MPTAKPARDPRTAVYVALAALLSLAGLDQTLLSTALPLIAADLHGQALLPWVFSAYLVASTIVIPLYGKLADHHGPRPLLVIAGSLFVAGSLACAASPSIEALIAARALQGLGGGGLMTLTLLSVAALYTPEERASRQGLLGAAYGIATMLGPLLGGLLVQHLSWRWALLLNAPAALVALALLARARFGQPQAGPERRLDWAGAALLAAALVCLLLATRSGLAGTAGGWALALLGLTLLLGFVAVERRAADPLLPLALFGNTGFSAAAVLSIGSGVGLFAAVVFLPLYLQGALRQTPTASALHLLPLMLGLTVASRLCGRALRRGASVRALASGGMLAMAGGFGALVGVLDWTPASAGAISLAVLPLGLGLGLLFPVLTVVSQRSAAPRHVGVATATPMMLRALGGAAGVSLLGSVLAHGVPAALAAHHGDRVLAFADPLQLVFELAAATALAALVAARLLPQRLPPVAGRATPG
ncbi:MAG: MFS transporter [Proteobacteria bacterium]|nr:MFS transporter [Pseudomonadota bacterium]